jgi:translation initiation factor 1
MADRGNERLVYSTAGGRVCPGCGWPQDNCRCAKTMATEPVPGGPARIVVKLRMEKKGRGGKTVTVIDNLPDNAPFLKDLCAELKRACGTGGAVADAAIELQGEQRDRVRALLAKKGYVIKG